MRIKAIITTHQSSFKENFCFFPVIISPKTNSIAKPINPVCYLERRR
jgi:hypothetical protein